MHDDLVQRKFTADKLNALWLIDITEHPTEKGKLYPCAVKDACSHRIVGYSINHRMTADLAVNALRNALMLRGATDALEVIVNSATRAGTRPASEVSELRNPRKLCCGSRRVGATDSERQRTTE